MLARPYPLYLLCDCKYQSHKPRQANAAECWENVDRPGSLSELTFAKESYNLKEYVAFLDLAMPL